MREAALLRQQAGWLAPARARLLRRAAIARRQSVLDLGAGTGAVTPELVRRSGGRVVALDRDVGALTAEPAAFAGAQRIVGDAAALPFADGAFDLVFCQCALLWMPLAATLAEIHRVLQPEGVLIALEPDHGGLIEHPEAAATRALWLAALQRAGADPCVGRKLPEALGAAGFRVRVELLSELHPPSPTRFELLLSLPLTAAERARVARLRDEQAGRFGDAVLAHLPFFLVTATR